MTVKALISNEILEWARKRTIGSLDEAAEYLRIDKSKLETWEKGDAQPTFNQAKQLAKKLKIPFGYLYLSAPPDESLPLPDLRVKPGTPPRPPSPDFLEVLYDAMRKQEWYHSYLQGEYADPVPFVGRFSNTSPIETVANDIRQTLGLNNEFRNQTQSQDHFYVRLVEQAESAGVLVMRNSVVGNNTHRPLDPNEFQGFAMLDSLAPLVFINQKDYLSAQIFTLMHELAHIWMGISGVSVQDYLESPVSQDEITQRQANEVAAEILVPRKDFISRWRSHDDPDQGLKTLQRHYRVSIFVILRRAFELGEIPFDYYRSTYYQLRSKITTKKRGGGSGYRNMFTRNSTTITISLLNSVSEGKTLPTQASSLLNVRPAVIYNLQNYLAER